MKTIRPANFLLLALLAVTVGCQGTSPVQPSPSGGLGGGIVSTQAASGQVELAIRWPYRAQVIPTSTQRLVIQVQGPTSSQTTVTRSPGEAPVSLATLDLEAGYGYRISIEAFDDSGSTLAIAAGQSDVFDALPNKKTSVTVALQATFVPSLASILPDNGGPGTIATLTGANLGMDRGLLPSVTFGGIPAAEGNPAGPGAITVRVPAIARTGVVGVTVDGVPDPSVVSFTVLSTLGIEPETKNLTSGGTFTFSARATSDVGVAFASPNVEWVLVPRPDPAFVNPDPEDPPEGSPYLPALGTIDQDGRFVSNGATGSQRLQIVSGSLVATATLNVLP